MAAGEVSVGVWWASLRDARAATPLLPALLAPVERARHEAIARADDRGRFLLGCALSRIALGELLGVAPAEVPLRRACPRCGGPHGKPRLAVPHGSPFADVDFSVTHSGDVVGVAVARGAAVGLDVEESGSGAALDVDTVAPVALTDAEFAALNARPPAERASAFLGVWTRKEAVLKALGVGLTVPPRRLEVSVPPLPPTVLSWPTQPPPPQALTMADVAVMTGPGRPPALATLAATGATALRAHHHDGTAELTAHADSTPPPRPATP
ncbi:4'-phosphopantetheinyl transferase superfamily protein [Streptomyces sp. NPDC006172]|uniref:4'-phosphopantetheinyl transferase family protein n=1 Tax=Streptomyces sp. NPDC006172 TaxID=3154470 RepID=UPI0033EC6F5B